MARLAAMFSVYLLVQNFLCTNETSAGVTINLIDNGDFAKGEVGQLPSGWTLYKRV